VPTSAAYHLYQSPEGDLVFLHPLCARCLLVAAKEDLALLPATVTAPVVEVEAVKVTAAAKQRTPLLRHLPVDCEVLLVEVDLTDLVPPDALAPFTVELDRRAQRRAERGRKAAKEKKKDIDHWLAQTLQIEVRPWGQPYHHHRAAFLSTSPPLPSPPPPCTVPRQEAKERIRAESERKLGLIQELINGPALPTPSAPAGGSSSSSSGGGGGVGADGVMPPSLDGAAAVSAGAGEPLSPHGDSGRRERGGSWGGGGRSFAAVTQVR